MTYKILVTEAMAEDGPEWLRAQGYEVKYGRGTDPQTLIEDLQDCDGVIPRLAVMSDDVISKCPKLKVIARHGAGVDTVDLESCKKHGVRVVNTRGSNSIAVAEHTIMLMLSCAKALKHNYLLYKNGCFKEARKNTISVEMSGKTIGLLGLGNIGMNVAKMAHYGFQMTVLAYDPYCKKEIPEWINIVDRTILFQNSDFISIHTTLTEQTRASVGMKEFSQMKPTAFIINTARGAIINEIDLIDALEKHMIAGAGLDATEPEPEPQDSPLFAMDNVVLTPHCAGSTLESKKRSSLGAAKGCDEILTGKTPTSLVL